MSDTPNLAAAIEKLVGYGRRLAGPALQRLPDGRTAFLVGDAVVETIDRQPADRAHAFTDLMSLLAWLRTETDRTQDDTVDIFVGPDHIVGLLDPFGARRELVSMALDPTDQWARFRGLLGAWKSFAPGPAFIRELRTLGLPGDVIAPFRGLVVTKNQRAEVSAKHGSDTLGQRVDREVLNADAIPDAFTVTVRPYQGLDLDVDVTVLVHLDTEHGAVELCLAPGTTEDVALRVREHVYTRVAEVGLPYCYGGHPVLRTPS